jgi:hypothetical protein
MVVVMVSRLRVWAGPVAGAKATLVGRPRPLVARMMPLELGEVYSGCAGVAGRRTQTDGWTLPALRHLAQALYLQLIGRLQQRLWDQTNCLGVKTYPGNGGLRDTGRGASFFAIFPATWLDRRLVRLIPNDGINPWGSPVPGSLQINGIASFGWLMAHTLACVCFDALRLLIVSCNHLTRVNQLFLLLSSKYSIN